MSKRVLIVSELFEPMNSIGAVRPSKLAKYLTKRGIEVTVFTSYKTRTDNNYSPEINLPKRNNYKKSKNENEDKKIEINNNLYIFNKNLNNNIDRIKINKDRDNELKKNKKKKKGGKFIDFNFKNIFKK